MSEKKLRKRAEESELKENGLKETASEEHVPEERAAEDFVQEKLQIRLPGRTWMRMPWCVRGWRIFCRWGTNPHRVPITRRGCRGSSPPA